MIDYDRVTRDAALRNGAVIHRDYAGMLPAVILNIMLENLGAAVAAALGVCRDGHAESVRRWRREGEARAEGILAAALVVKGEAASRAIGDVVGKAAGMARVKLAGPILRQSRELDTVVERMRRHALVMIAGYGVLFIAALAASLF